MVGFVLSGYGASPLGTSVVYFWRFIPSWIETAANLLDTPGGTLVWGVYFATSFGLGAYGFTKIPQTLPSLLIT